MSIDTTRASTLPVDARDLANYILDVADVNCSTISNLALQKILYFCHANFLVHFDTPLFHNPIEAWRFGPVVRSVYETFRVFGREPITARALHLDPLDGRVFVVPFRPAADAKYFLENVISAYSKMDAFALACLTHEQDGPWSAALEAYGTTANVGLRIEDDLIRERFCKSKARIIHMI